MNHLHFDDLQKANNTMITMFENYDKDIRKLICKIKCGIIEYLHCDPKNIVWLRFAEIEEEEESEEYNRNNIRKISPDRLLLLYTNGYYRFVFRFKFESGSIDMGTLVKIQKGKIILKIGDQTIELNTDNQEEFDKLIENVCQWALEYMEKRFDDFINEHHKKALGFTPNNS